VFFLDKKLFAADFSDIVIQGAYHGVVVGALSILIYTRAVNSLGAAQTALFTAAVPCLTTLGAIPLLGEIPSQLAASGLAIVTVGMVIAIQSSMARTAASR
jgi:drug/metabolite transporter (DMT)-like permease